MTDHATDVLIYRFGEIPGLSLTELAGGITGAYRVSAAPGGQLPLPEEGFDVLRAQYVTTVFLAALVRLDRGTGAAPVRLGITDKDIFVPRLNFVFGEADPADRVAVVSTHRLRPEYYGEAPDLERLRQRILKECVHELGHVFGLGHCDNRFCIMHFSNAIADTDRKGPGFCQECQMKLAFKGLGRGS